ncbi:hypothetical protein BGX20_000867 [Mortierella sp. AD010]|nr:hypothetical protein BGX20_000867 [Mortierella sp. AD010]
MQSWNSRTEDIKKLAERDYDVVISSADFFYLDCGNGDWVTNDPRYNVNNLQSSDNHLGSGASWCDPYKTWQRIYAYDFTEDLADEEAKKIIGGEAALWSKQADASVVENKVWLRAAALAELLWSGNRNKEGYKRTTELSARIFDYRERMVARGNSAHLLAPKYCLKHPRHCDLICDRASFGQVSYMFYNM